MASNNVDYIARDFDSIVDSLISYATINFGPDTTANRQWTDFNADDFSRTWLELLAYVGDQIFYYLDVQATQSNLETATIRSVVLNIAKQFGYILPTASSASGTAVFTLSTSTTIPVGFRLSSTSGALFFVASSTPLAGSTALSSILPVIQGEQKIDTFTAKGVQNEEFVLNFPGLVKDLDNTISLLRSPRVLINSVPFTLVESFVNSLPTENHFTMTNDSDGRTVLRFGNNIFGKKLSPSDSLQVNYRVGGGTVGNIAASSLTTLVDSDTSIVSVTNTLPFSGGADELTTDRLKQLIPAQLRTLDRAVALQDYSDIVLAAFPEVSKAMAEQNTEDAQIDINLYIAPTGNTVTAITSNVTLLNTLSDFIDERKPVTTTISIKDAFSVDILIKVEVFVASGVSKLSVAENIQSTLEAFFDLDSGDIDGAGTKFGQTILLNDIYALIDTVEGIDRFEIKKFHYRPRIEVKKALAANYLHSEVILFPNAEESQWIAVPEYSATSPEYVPYSVYKQQKAIVSNLNENSISDTNLNLSVVESTTSAINVNSTSNVIFDSSKTFLVDEFVGGTTAVTLNNGANDTWEVTGYSFPPRVGDRINQGTNVSYVKEVLGFDNFVLASGNPAALIDAAASLTRDAFLLVDSANNIWSIQDNDSHSLVLSQYSINDVTITDVSAGAYKIVKSYIGANLVFKGLVFSGIDYNTHNTFYRFSSNFNLVGTIKDEFLISSLQVAKGNFGVPTTIDTFTSSTPNPGVATVHFAGQPDLSSVTAGVGSRYILIDSNQNSYEIVAVSDSLKTVTIIHQSGNTVDPITGPASVCEVYYSDDNEISFAIGAADLTSGPGFPAHGVITTPVAASISDGETFTLNDGVNAAVVFEFNKTGGVTGANVEVDISAATTANEVRDIMITAINGATIAIGASNGGAGKIALLNDSVGTAGNQTITDTVANAGFIVVGMSGGLSSGKLPTPSIPGVSDVSNDLGFDSAGTILDNFKFRISNYVDDIVNLRKNEIPQFNSTDLVIDSRGGVS